MSPEDMISLHCDGSRMARQMSYCASASEVSVAT